MSLVLKVVHRVRSKTKIVSALLPLTLACMLGPRLGAVQNEPRCRNGSGMAGASEVEVSGDRTHIQLECDGVAIEVLVKGNIEFSVDRLEIVDLGQRAYFKVREGKVADARRLDVSRSWSGNLEHRWTVGRKTLDMSEADRSWLRAVVLETLRATGAGVEERVAELLQVSGSESALDEIDHLAGDQVKGLYYREILRQAKLAPDSLASFLGHVKKSVSTDFEIREVLEAVLGAGSNYEEETLGLVLATSTSIDSEFELSRLLGRVAEVYPKDLELPATYFRSMQQMTSDLGVGKVLLAVADRPELSPRELTGVLGSALIVSSDFEKAQLLTSLVRRYSIESSMRPDLNRVLSTFTSEHEKKRVLTTLGRS